MASNDTLVVLSLLLGLVAFAFMWKLGRGAKAQAVATEMAAAAAGTSHDELLLKFVEDDAGQRRGETVAIEGESVVVKSAEGFLLLPASNLESAGGVVRVKGSVDWDEARREGEAWRKRSYKEITYLPEELPRD